MKKPLVNLFAGLVLTATASSAMAACNDKPIVFVHGYNSSVSTWNTMVDRFKDYGYESCALYRFGYNSTGDSNRDSAVDLADFVDDILADPQHAAFNKIRIIAHSNGGLVSRWYRVFEGGESKNDEFVTLATPHDGTSWANFCAGVSPACQNMQSGSGFLTSLGEDGCVHAIWSDFDEVVLPNKSAKCDGDGTSNKIAFSEGISHSEIKEKGNPWQKVKKYLGM